MTSTESSLLVERDNGTVTVTFNRPQTKNGLRNQEWLALAETLAEVSRNTHDRVVILTGAGGNFSSGAELGGPEDDMFPLAGMQIVNDACMAIRRLNKPVIAAVSGYAVGAGFNLVLTSDLAVADTTAQFSQIFVKRGMSPDFGGSWHLPQALSLHKAKELAFFGDKISAVEARDLGLINHVVPPEELTSFCGDWAARLTALPPIALARTKHLLNASPEGGFAAALDREAVAQEHNFTTLDTHEAISAFLEKRSPRYLGR
ncbi:enoyl-CoA hydratase/isomerase family protein [Gordonia rubripertincta]|uniref:Enoyl-CoA hydratase-related protein n=1 Tax=Gordonia rubripertincta TaxID=36822 RepID=A0ABT4MVN7_GORRU|nr:enoyl-CoA hydratase-related protein [Gordonia rubripertincta]MCZ4551074.1 enoyl-CoA hydratase-related protein [Gordonia rubripertincta]